MKYKAIFRVEVELDAKADDAARRDARLYYGVFNGINSVKSSELEKLFARRRSGWEIRNIEDDDV